MSKPVSKGKIVLVGEPPLVDDLAALCVDAGHEVSIYLVEEVAEPNGLRKMAEDARTASVALDVTSESLEAKRDLVRVLDRSLPAAAPLLTACLSVSATQVAAWAEHADWVVGFGVLPPFGKGSLVELALPLQGQAVTLGKARAAAQAARPRRSAGSKDPSRLLRILTLGHRPPTAAEGDAHKRRLAVVVFAALHTGRLSGKIRPG